MLSLRQIYNYKFINITLSDVQNICIMVGATTLTLVSAKVSPALIINPHSRFLIPNTFARVVLGWQRWTILIQCTPLHTLKIWSYSNIYFISSVVELPFGGVWTMMSPWFITFLIALQIETILSDLLKWWAKSKAMIVNSVLPFLFAPSFKDKIYSYASWMHPKFSSLYSFFYIKCL